MEKLIVWAPKYSSQYSEHLPRIQRFFFFFLLRIKPAAVMCFYSERSGFIKCSSSQSFTCSWNTLNASQQNKSSQDNDDPWDIPVQISTKQLYLFNIYFLQIRLWRKFHWNRGENYISMRLQVTVVIIHKKTCKNVYFSSMYKLVLD